MVIHDAAKNPRKRVELPIAPIHLRLSTAENWIRKENTAEFGTQNLVAVDMSFEISWGNHTPNGNHRRDFITFPLRIPGKQFYTVSDAFVDQENDLVQRRETGVNPTNHTYRLMRERYTKGHNITGHNYCGYAPKFVDVQTDKQYTHHSEQALYTYLATQDGVKMLTNRLTTEIRGRGIASPGDTIKIYAVGLHIHSTKTPCGPCERSTVGVQNSQWHVPGEKAQFLELFMGELENRSSAPLPNQQHSILNFTYPGQYKGRAPHERGPRMFTTYTANTHDKDHKAARPSAQVRQALQDGRIRNKVFVANYGFELNEDYLNAHEADLPHRTIFASASNEDKKNTPKSKERIRRVAESSDQYVEVVRNLFADVSLAGRGSRGVGNAK